MKARMAGLLLVTGVLLGSLAFLLVNMSQRGQGENGVGFTYRGEFYSQTDAEVRPERLGPFLERDVRIRDTTTDVRAITGLDPETAVAAQIRDSPSGPSKDGVAWLLMTRDDDLAAVPWSDPGLAAAVYPEE